MALACRTLTSYSVCQVLVLFVCIYCSLESMPGCNSCAVHECGALKSPAWMQSKCCSCKMPYWHDWSLDFFRTNDLQTTVAWMIMDVYTCQSALHVSSRSFCIHFQECLCPNRARSNPRRVQSNLRHAQSKRMPWVVPPGQRAPPNLKSLLHGSSSASISHLLLHQFLVYGCLWPFFGCIAFYIAFRGHANVQKIFLCLGQFEQTSPAWCLLWGMGVVGYVV